MINKRKLEEQLDNIKKDPTYIDYFIGLMTRNFGGNIEHNIEVIKDAMSLISIFPPKFLVINPIK